jgi:hypothetical protein
VAFKHGLFGQGEIIGCADTGIDMRVRLSSIKLLALPLPSLHVTLAQFWALDCTGIVVLHTVECQALRWKKLVSAALLFPGQ